VRVDFDKDGKEDILWRYYGAGGYNRVWYLGTVGQPSAESLGTEVQTGQDSFGSMAAEARSMRAAAKSLRDLGLVSRKRMKSRARIPAGLMIMDAKKMQDVGSVDDPRKVRGQYLSDVRLLEPTRTSDPRSVGSVSSGPRPEDQAAADATLSSLPQFLGGADIWPVDDMNWHICGAADFDKDGNIDILWRNVSTGVNIIWFMVGTQWSRSAELLLVQDQNWQIVGTGDFDNDGNVDILWRNSVYGWNTVWHMNGSSWLRSSPVMTVTDLTWQIVGTGDFNKDGNVDILWRNSVSGANVVWNMNGTSWSSSVPLITVDNLAWQIAGTGDYNNDGNIDILWRFYGAGGANVIWYMNGASWSVSGELLPVQNLSWKIVSR